MYKSKPVPEDEISKEILALKWFKFKYRNKFKKLNPQSNAIEL